MAQSGDLTCAQLVELVSDYLGGALTPADEARVEAHLAGCAGCSIYLEQLSATIELTGRLRPDDVPEDAAKALLAAFRDWNAPPL
jgi:anti-sigma factor RsiW